MDRIVITDEEMSILCEQLFRLLVQMYRHGHISLNEVMESTQLWEHTVYGRSRKNMTLKTLCKLWYAALQGCRLQSSLKALPPLVLECCRQQKSLVVYLHPGDEPLPDGHTVILSRKK